MFHEVSTDEVLINPFKAFGKDWMALAAGNEGDGVGTMCIGWGHMGAIWAHRGGGQNLPTAVVYVRPSRQTKEFVDKEELFTVCAFTPEYKKALGYIGSHSGREGDKLTPAGLTPVYSDGTVYFAEAKQVFICRKLYHAPLVEEGFLDKDMVDLVYPERDFHEIYVGEIIKILEADQ